MLASLLRAASGNLKEVMFWLAGILLGAIITANAHDHRLLGIGIALFSAFMMRVALKSGRERNAMIAEKMKKEFESKNKPQKTEAEG